MEIETYSPIEVTAELKKYTLVGDDIYVKRYTNDTVPDWYRSLISDMISRDGTITDINAAIAYLESLPTGYNQMITSLQNKDLLIDTSLESLVTKDGQKTAAIADLNITKVDSTSAQAIARDVVGSYFSDGSAGAWFNNQISTYARNIAAHASSISTLNAVLGSESVRIDTVESAVISNATATNLTLAELQTQIDGAITTWFYTTAPTLSNVPALNWTTDAERNIHLGDIYYDKSTGYGYRFAHEDINDSPDLGLIYTWIHISDIDVVKALANAAAAQATADGKSTAYYLQTAPTLLSHPLLESGDTWVDSDGGNILSTWNGSAWINAQTSWSANASKLITSPDGSITGWSFGDGTNARSYFQINATNFKISDGITGYTPFSIVGNKISFNGVVEFTNIANVPALGATPQQVVDAVNTGTTTSIDGGKITATSLLINSINAIGGIIANNLQAGIASIGNTISSIDFLSIGGGGFRLKSNALGTYSDPTIYGAYIRGGYIKGATIDGANLIGEVLSVNNMKFNNSTYPLNTANILVKGHSETPMANENIPAQYGGVVSFISASYGTGFSQNRIVALNKMFIFSSNAYVWSGIAGTYVFAGIEVSVDGGAYYTIFNAPSTGFNKTYISISFNSTITFRAKAWVFNGTGMASMSFDVECFNFNFS